MEDVLATLFGRPAQVGDPGLAVGVLTNRLQRTAIQVGESDEEVPPPGRDAAFAAVTTSVNAVSSQLAAYQGDIAATRRLPAWPRIPRSPSV
jgi:hypothetical protein